MRVRTVRKAKAIGKTGKAVVKSNAVAGFRQLRCQRCGQMCQQTKMPDGTPAYQCVPCGAIFGCRRM